MFFATTILGSIELDITQQKRHIGNELVEEIRPLKGIRKIRYH